MSVADRLKQRAQAAQTAKPETQAQAAPAAQPATGLRSRLRQPVQSQEQNTRVDNSANSGAATGIYKGSQIMQQMAAENTRKQLAGAMRSLDRRFFLKKGTSTRIVLLDHEYGAAIKEHSVKIGQDRKHIPCIQESDNCPACAAYGNPSFVVMLTCLDMTPYEHNGKHYEYSKKLLVLKGEQQQTFSRIYEKNNRDFRGLVLEMTRGNSPTSFANGEPMIDGARLTDEELQAEFMLAAPVLKQDGSVLHERDYYLKPFDYERMIVFPTASQMRDLLGGAAPVGSSDYVNESWDNKNGGGEGTRQNATTDDIPIDDAEAN